MSSFDVVNYSLRPSKTIERQIVFNGINTIIRRLAIERAAYIGFGSVWFTDFIMAHKQLRIEDMLSMEANPVGYRRARFNKPYKTVTVLEGKSHELLPPLFENEEWCKRPWIIWLDYDGFCTESLLVDIRSCIEKAPENSILLVTFNGHPSSYSRKPADRPIVLKGLFGNLMSDDFPKDCTKDELGMCNALADLVLDFMASEAAAVARPGGFVSAFRLLYKDGAPMVTVGGILPTREKLDNARHIINEADWICRPEKQIVAPHLTVREALLLQSKLPSLENLSRDDVQNMGFDLQEEQITSFQTYYLMYPYFAQIMA